MNVYAKNTIEKRMLAKFGDQENNLKLSIVVKSFWAIIEPFR